MKVADPYPVAFILGDLTPIVDVTFYGVEGRIASLNYTDPQPPGYRYRLPLSEEYFPWVERRDFLTPKEAYGSWPQILFGAPSYIPNQQGISYYEDGLWFHVGGSVYCWCGDPLSVSGNRVIRGGSWASFSRGLRAASRGSAYPVNSCDDLGYRLVRGPLL